MSDISINLEGLISFLAAVGLSLLLLLGILIAALDTLMRAHRRRESWVRQRLFPQLLGLLVSFSCCLLLLILLLYGNSKPAPRPISIWLDHWVWLWLVVVLGLWPLSAFTWAKRWQTRPAE